MFEPEIVKVSSTRFETKEEIITYLSQKAGHAKKSRMLKAMSMQYWIVSPRHQLLWDLELRFHMVNPMRLRKPL